MTTEKRYTPIISKLRDANLRPTRQRIALAELMFRGEDRHISAEMLHKEATTARVSVSLATVYNTLHQFTQAGLLREIAVEAGRSYFDTNTSNHHHFYFENDGHLEDVHADEVVVSSLPTPPGGAKISRVDVVIRVRQD
ncbi:MAG: transcriptional repressor [Rhodospirillales bacterium]|jgi:Fur family transcriptional regulator, iron response regulator|nr:transcriptional repressor [Rhodospirillales bacterium]